MTVSGGGVIRVGSMTEFGSFGTLLFSTGGTLSIAEDEVFDYGPTEGQWLTLTLGSGSTIDGPGTYQVTGSQFFDGVTLASGGRIDNDGDITLGNDGLTINGELDNSGGTMNVASNSTITLNSGGTTSLAGSIALGGGVQIQGSSTLDVLQITGRLSSNGDASNQDTISANLEVSETGSIVVGGSNGQDGSLVITGNFVNNGFVQVDPTNQNVNGVLLIDNDFVNSGTLQVDNAATLIVGDSNDDGTIDGGGMMTNSGTLMGFDPGTSEEAILRLGSIANTGKIALPGNGQGDAARMTFQGTHINSMSGALALGMGAVLTLSNSTLAVASGTTYENDNGTLVLGSGGVLDIGGSHSVTSSVNSTIVLESGASIGGDGTLVNQGLMNLDGVTIDSVFDNVSTEGGTGDISLFSGEMLTVHGRLINRDGAELNVSGGTLSGTGTVEHQGTFTTNGATIDEDLRFEGAMRISGTGTAFTVDGLARGNIIVNATTATAIDGDGVLEITGGEISGAGLRLSTGVDVLQVGVLTFGSTSGRISVVSSDWVFGDQAGFTDNNGTLTINGGARIGVAENVDFHYDSTSMAHLQLASGGTAEMFGDGTFTNAGGTLTAGDGTLNLSIDRFVNEAAFNVDTYVMVGEDTHLSNTATLNVLSGTLASQGILANAGTLNVSGSVVDIHNGIFTNTGEINLDGNNGTAVLYSSVDFTNNGLIRMDESGVGFGAEIDMYNYNDNNGHQTLTNAGTIEANNSSERVGLDHLIAGNLINTGLIDVNNDLNFGYIEGTNGFSLDTRDGAIAIEGGTSLSIRHDNSLIVGADTTLSGNGEIDMISGSTLSVATGETFAFDSTTGPDIRFNGTGALDGGGTFSNTGGTLTIDSNTLSVSVSRFENAGTVNIEEANVSFTGMDFANSGQLNVLNGDVVFADTLTATNSGTIGLDAGDNFGAMVLNGTNFTNTGAIVFDSSSGGNYSSTLEGLSDAVVNNSGRIVFANSGGGILRHKLESDTTNTGTITVNDDTLARFGTSEGASGLHLDSRDGRIEIGEDGTLEVRSTLTLGNDSAVTGDGTLAFQNGSTLSIAQGETFTLGEGSSTTSEPATVVAPVSVRTSNAFDPTVKVLSDGRIMTTTVTSDGGTIHIQVRDPATNNVVDGHSVGVNTSNVFAVTQLSDGTFRMVTDTPQVSNNRIRVYNFDDEFAFNGSQAVSTTVPAGQRFDDFEIHPTSNGGYIIVGQNVAAGEIRILFMNNDDTVLETVSHAVSGMDTGLDADVFPNGDVVVYYGEDNGSAVNRKAVFVDADDQTTTLHHIGGAASDSDVHKAVAVLDATTYVEASISSHFGAEVFIRKAPGAGVNTIQLPDFDPDTFAQSIDVTAMTDGGFAVAWSVSNGTDVDVYVQRYNAAGEAIGDPINATQAGNGSQTVGATGDQTNVRIDMINGSEFVVIYENGSGAVSYSRGTFGAVVQAEAQPTMTFSGTFELTGGVLSNETETDISAEVFRIDSDAELRNSGTLTFDAGTMEIASLLNQGSLSNSGVIDFVSGTLTSNGSLTNTGTISVGTQGTIQNQGDMNNAGTLNINGGDLESLSGGLTNTGQINLTGSNSNSAQFVTGDMTNDGTIRMNDDGTGFGAQIDLYDYIEESGHNTLTNAGTISVNNTGEGQSANFSIVGHVINTGRIDINTELAYGYSEGPNGFALDTRDGTINVASDSELTIRYNNTLVVGSDTEFTGSGTLDLREDSSLIVADGENFTYDSASAPVIDFGGTVAIDGGTFTNAAGSTLTAGSSDDVSLSTTQFVNNGVLEAVNGGAFTIFTSNFNNSQGTLNILGDSVDADLYIRTDMSLGGVIRLDGGSGTITDADLDTFANTLTVTGTLHSTSQNSLSTEDNDLYGHFVNQGLFDIDQDTELEGSSDTLDSRDGTIDVASGKTFEIDGSLTVGTDTSITGGGTVAIDESHFIVADSEHFTHTGSAEIRLTDGILEGAGTFTNYGAVTFDGGTLSSAGTLAVDFFSNYGQFTAGQGTLTLATTGFANETEGVEGSTGTFTLDAGSIGTSTVKLDEDFQNAGVLELTGSGTLANAVLTHTSAEIVENSSQGTILITSVGDAGGRTLDLGIENLGTIDVGVLTTLTAGHTLDNSAGTIALGANGTLEILGELTMGQSSKINGVAGGLIDVKGTLSVAEDDTATNEGGADNLVLSDGATLAGLGTFRNVGDVELSGVTLAISAIDNDGTLRAQDGTLDLGTTTVIDNTGGTISAVSSFSTGAIEISESATLGGKILLDIAAGTDGASLTVAAGESLTVSGVLQTAENVPFGLDNVISEHTITGSIVNTGTFDIDHSTNIFGDLDSTDGDIEIASSAVLNIKSGNTLTVGDETDLTGNGTLTIESGSELDVAAGETFTIGEPSSFNLGTAVVATLTSNIQEKNPDMAALAGGGFWVAYDTDVTAGLQDHIRMFNSDGTATGTVITLNAGGDFEAKGTQIAALGNGNVVAGYIEDVDGGVLNFKVFNPDGTSTTLSPASYGQPEHLFGSITNLDLTAFGTGATEGFLASFTEDDALKALHYDSQGNVVGTLVIDGSGVNASISPQSAGLNDGKGVIVYADSNGTDNTILARVIDTDGTSLTTVTLGTTDSVSEIDVTALSNGNFGVAWNDGTNTYVQGFDSSGGTTTALGTILTGSTVDIDVSAGLDGGMHVLIDTGTGHIVYNLDSVGNLIDIETLTLSSGTLTGTSDIIGFADGSYALAYSTGDIEVHTAEGVATTVQLNGNNITGTGTLAIATGHDQNIDGVTLSLAAVDNDGTLSVEAGAAVTLAATTLSGEGVLEINSSQVSAGNIVLTGNATNAAGHTIALTNNDTTLSTAGSITTANGSTLVNLGVITGAASAGSYAFAANIANAGAILLSDSATLFAGKTLDTSDGTLTITEGEVLGLNGNLILGADTELDAQLNLGSSGTVSVADGEVFTFDGNGNQGLSFVSGGTISGTGTFRNTDALFDLANGKIGSTALFDNDAKVSVSDGEGIIATANFDNTGGTIEVSSDDTDAGTLTINSNMTNAGLLAVDLNGGGQLPGLDTIIRTTGGGHLINTGTFLVQNSGFGFSGQLNLGIDVTNTGLISYIGNVDLGSGRVLDTTDGTLLVTNDDLNESSTELTMNGSTLVVGTDTVFGTANEATAGTINIGSGGALKLTDGEDFTYGLNTPILNFESGGSITGTGEMTVTGSLNLTGATIGSSVIIDNDGDVYVQDGALTLRPSNLDNAGGTLFILSDTDSGSVSISNSGTLAGTVILGTANNGNDDSTLSVGSGQVLTLTGTLVSQDEASSGLSHEVFGTVVNRGLVLVEAELNINDHLDSTDGDFSITPNQILDLDGTLSLGTDTDLLGSGTIFVDDGAVLNVNNDENFTYTGDGATFDFGEEIEAVDIEITGGGTFTNQTELYLSEDVTLSINQLVNDGGTIGILNEGLFLDLSGTTITNQNNGVFNVGTLTGTGRFTNETNMTINSFVADGAVTLVNNGTFETDSGTIVLTGASASMTIGTTGTLSETGVDSMTIQMNDGASVENRGLISLSDSSGTALTLENDGTGNGTFANTGTIDFGTSSTEIRIRDGATMSIRAGTTFSGAAGIIALTNGGALAFDTDFTLSSNTFVLDSVSEGGTLPLLTGTGTLTNTGGIDNFGFLNIDVAKFVNQATVDAGTSTISTNDFVNDAIGTMEIASETLTINGVVTNNGLFQIGNGAVTGTGAFNNAGQMEVIASVTDVNANFTGLSTFTNSGTLTLKSTSSGDIPTLTVGDFVNSGTISFESGNFTDAAVLKLGASGNGTLTNEGLITNILSRDINVPSDAFTIMGDVTAGASGGTIHVVDYVTVAGATDGSLAITGDLTLNENSTTIIESGSGSIGGVLNVQGTVTYAGAFELRVDTGLNFIGSFEALRTGTAVGSPDRIRILDSTGTTDFGLNQFGKLVLPNFNNGGNLEFQFVTPTDILSSAGSLIGDTGHEYVLGSVGDDIMTTGSDGRSRFYGRGGNDSFTLSASAETDFVDGGIGGRDIIYTNDLNFGDYEAWRINNIEALDFSAGGSGTISMNQEFIYGISEDINEILNGLAIDDALKDDALIIEGHSGQTLALDQNDWTATGTTVSVDHDQNGSSSSYAIYSASNGAHAFVDTDMQVNLAATPS